MENFRRKARLVAGGNMTDPPAAATYASVVSRESVQIALTIAALNDLDILAAGVENAYLNAPISERVWTECGAEFGGQKGKKALIVWALYGLKSAGAAFQNLLASCMRNLGYTPCLANNDVWFWANVHDSDGFEYYEYILIYVDDILCVSHDVREALKRIDKFFLMKNGVIECPDIYLGAKISKVWLPNGVEAWAMSPSKYIQEAPVSNVEDYLALRWTQTRQESSDIIQKRLSAWAWHHSGIEPWTGVLLSITDWDLMMGRQTG
jgi:hypothetical protein